MVDLRGAALLAVPEAPSVPIVARGAAAPSSAKAGRFPGRAASSDLGQREDRDVVNLKQVKGWRRSRFCHHSVRHLESS